MMKQTYQNRILTSLKIFQKTWCVWPIKPSKGDFSARVYLPVLMGRSSGSSNLGDPGRWRKLILAFKTVKNIISYLIG